jgi:hypothetical protein
LKTIGCLLILAALAASPASAQPEAGDNELQFQGSTSFDFEDQDRSAGSLFANYGRFLSVHHEVGASGIVEIKGSGDFSGFGGAFYRYNFPLGRVVPYAGVSVRAGFGDFSSDPKLDFESGIRWYLEPKVAFTLATNAGDIDSEDFGKKLDFLFGFSYLPGR